MSYFTFVGSVRMMILLISAVIAQYDTQVTITFLVNSSTTLEVIHEGSTYTQDDSLVITLKAYETLQLTANVDLTGDQLCIPSLFCLGIGCFFLYDCRNEAVGLDVFF